MTEVPQRWALLNLQYAYLSGGILFTATTNCACHLFCRITKQPPLTHPIPVLRRGTLWRTDVRFCFTVFEDNEQTEPGDTLQHTFLKCQEYDSLLRWFYFYGTISGLASPSETAIFKITCARPVRYHTHGYSVYWPDGNFVDLWNHFGNSWDDGVEACALGHPECKFKADCRWLTTPTRYITRQPKTSQRAAYGEGHTHTLDRITVSDLYANRIVYDSKPNVCPSGHVACGQGGIATWVRYGIPLHAFPVPTSTNPEIEGDPNDEHHHSLYSQGGYSTTSGRISAVYNCPLGHPLCQNDEIAGKVYFFHGLTEWIRTGRDEAV